MTLEQALERTQIAPIPLEGYGRMYTEAQVTQLLEAAETESNQWHAQTINRLRQKLNHLNEDLTFAERKRKDLEQENYELREKEGL